MAAGPLVSEASAEVAATAGADMLTVTSRLGALLPADVSTSLLASVPEEEAGVAATGTAGSTRAGITTGVAAAAATFVTASGPLDPPAAADTTAAGAAAV